MVVELFVVLCFVAIVGITVFIWYVHYVSTTRTAELTTDVKANTADVEKVRSTLDAHKSDVTKRLDGTVDKAAFDAHKTAFDAHKLQFTSNLDSKVSVSNFDAYALRTTDRFAKLDTAFATLGSSVRTSNLIVDKWTLDTSNMVLNDVRVDDVLTFSHAGENPALSMHPNMGIRTNWITSEIGTGAPMLYVGDVEYGTDGNGWGIAMDPSDKSINFFGIEGLASLVEPVVAAKIKPDGTMEVGTVSIKKDSVCIGDQCITRADVQKLKALAAPTESK